MEILNWEDQGYPKVVDETDLANRVAEWRIALSRTVEPIPGPRGSYWPDEHHDLLARGYLPDD